MSWVKRRAGPGVTPPAGPSNIQMYNPNQHSTQETQWQQPHDNWTNQKGQEYWQQPYQYNQNTPQQFHYHEQGAYFQNDPNYQQQPPPQSYGNLQYNQQQQFNTNTTQLHQNNAYETHHQQQQQQQQLQQQQQQQPPVEGDAWNWGWGDEDNSNNTQSMSRHRQQQHLQQQQQQQPGMVPAPNNVTNSFSNDGTWDWSLEQEGKNVAKIDKKIDGDDMGGGGGVDVGGGIGVVNVVKRGKLESAQWSIESQLSQESSDDVLQTSESDKSHMLSRSSTISHSPIGQDLASAAHPDDNLELSPPPALQHFENKEIIAHDLNQTTPPPPVALLNTQTPPLLPPSNVDDPKSNPYKLNTGISHKNTAKFRASPLKPPTTATATPLPIQPSQQPQPQQGFHMQSNFANLETLPDNSEQPDPIPTPPRKTTPNNAAAQWPENNEAPINDRNQYLETGQLSDINQNGDDNDTLPPPGLRRMVLGQMGRGEGQGNDEPPLPPNFSRMVPGQLETTSMNSTVPVEPPAGLRRMVPGESSSPETRQSSNEPELELQPRSATIGADTPPAVPNPIQPQAILRPERAETIIGADISPDAKLATEPSRGRGTSGSSNGTLGKKSKRRDSIEGENLATAVRTLSLKDNQSEESAGEGKPSGRRRGGSSRDSSESDRDPRTKSPSVGRDRRERRYKDEPRDRRDRDRERGDRGRYSPDDYRDKKYDRRKYKDRRYEEDTDYYSDKDKERRHKDDRDYERKYSSLRKDKDKERRRRTGDYGRDSRNYYGRYEDEYENESRSRASSRSDSMHEAYRERDKGHGRERRHREKERHRRHRDVFNPYTQGFGYDIYNQYYQQYHYYENLRKTNPQAYAQLYQKYYQNASGETPSYGGEERASVHSGRSSVNDELTKDRYTRQSYYSQTSLPHLGGYYRDSQTHSVSGQYGLDDSSFVRTLDQTDTSLNYEDPHLTAQRLTPAKFSTAHIKASITSGKMVKILPNYPLDGQNATVELCNLAAFLSQDPDYCELKEFPGPLTKGSTHKKTIIEYCENKIKDVNYNLEITDPDSYVLMWELLILLVRQNGMVVGTDIAELLLKNHGHDVVQRATSSMSSIASNLEDVPEILPGENNSNSAHNLNLKEEEITNKFRDFLLYGSGKEALEWAMKHGLWGHALFLASKLDKRTYANVLMRFANGLTMNDPLQTLYQLLSGKIPAAVTCVADEKWGDWRPHLAMILSNSTQRPELNCKAITTLGDTLMCRGSLYAAQFCYLMAEVNFSAYGTPDAKLVLLGSNHNKTFRHFATNEAIHMTEIYEYARSLNDSQFTLVEFQHYKYLLATRLADVGLLEKSLSYLERIANFIVENPSSFDSSFIGQVTDLADKLKFYDPVGDVADEDAGFGANLDTSRPDNSWLKDLRAIQSDFKVNQNYAMPTNTVAPPVDSYEPQNYSQPSQDVWQPQQYEHYQPEVEPQPVSEPQEAYGGKQYQDQQQYWPGQSQWGDYSQQPEPSEQPQQSYYGSLAQSEPEEVEKVEQSTEEIQPPKISMPNQHKSASNAYNDEPQKDVPRTPTEKAPSTKSKGQELGDQKQQSGWFGGIFSKLTLKPKNQMKLPDDKNPSIVWDPEKKRWINTEEESGGGGSEFKPPPKMTEMKTPQQMAPSYNSVAFNPPQMEAPKMTEQPGVVEGKPPSGNNMFKLQRSRNLKKSYIDVFNPNGKQAPGSGGGGQMMGAPASAGGPQASLPQMNFFVPQPVHDPNAPVDFLTPAPPMQYEENAQQPSQ